MRHDRSAKSHLHSLRSIIPGVDWPAIPDPVAANLLAMLTQLEESQWWQPHELMERQLRQFGLLARHASQQSPFFRDRFGKAGLDAAQTWTQESFSHIPLLTRAELMQQAEQIFCRALPPNHGGAHKVQSSGSTGQMITVLRTDVTQLFWLAIAMRDHLWHERDFSTTLAIIKALAPARDDPAQAALVGWGHPSTLLLNTGPSYAQPLSMDVVQQAQWLARIDPTYLLTYPSNLAALLDLYEHGTARPPALQHVRTIGETLHPGLRERCHTLAGIDIVDLYSSQEVGLIALQCPVSGLYHTQDESLIVEVLNDSGHPCAPGEIGRVVITDLHNFATPLIRYEIRDYAEAGPPCPCGRGLGTLTRIMGRRRNMVTLPDGRRHWPLVGAYHYRDIADIRQYQAIQHAPDDIEIRLVVDPALTAEQEAAITHLAHQALGHPFPLRFSYFTHELPGTQGGKFEEFISRVD